METSAGQSFPRSLQGYHNNSKLINQAHWYIALSYGFLQQYSKVRLAPRAKIILSTI
jgi:hypothetical protein